MNRDRALNELASQLLTADSGVYISGLGVFYRKRDRVEHSSLSRRLEPPHMRWYLNRILVNPRSQDAMSLWPYPSSILINEVPADWTQPFVLNGLGAVTPSGVGEGRLEPEHPLLVHYLASYRFPAIVPPKRLGLHPSSNGSDDKKIGGKETEFQKTWSMMGRAALWIALLGPALFLWMQFNVSDEMQRAGVGGKHVRHDSSLLPEFPRLYPPSEPLFVDPMIVDSTAENQAPIDTFSMQSTFDVVVVVGCFSSRKNAERQQNLLIQEGFEPAVLESSPSGLTRVGAILTVHSVAEADSFLTHLRAKIHPEAWLLE